MLVKIFRQLYENEIKRDSYVDSIPSDVRMAFIDNGYVSSLLEERDMLIKLMFKEHSESIEWFLYEWRPGFEVSIDGIKTKINSIDDYISWMQLNESFPLG